MKTRLSQLTMAQYIDVLCGDVEALTEGASMGASEIDAIRRGMIYEYASIAHPAEVQSVLSRKSDGVYSSFALSFFTILHRLCAMGACREARGLLIEYGIHDAVAYNDERTLAEVEQRMRRAKSMAERDRDGNGTESEWDSEKVRRSFSHQIASLMSHFKFQINVNEMKADVFAHLVAQAEREVKAQMSAMKRK